MFYYHANIIILENYYLHLKLTKRQRYNTGIGINYFEMPIIAIAQNR